jgi:hypothetical protein
MRNGGVDLARDANRRAVALNERKRPVQTVDCGLYAAPLRLRKFRHDRDSSFVSFPLPPPKSKRRESKAGRAPPGTNPGGMGSIARLITVFFQGHPANSARAFQGGTADKINAPPAVLKTNRLSIRIQPVKAVRYIGAAAIRRAAHDPLPDDSGGIPIFPYVQHIRLLSG